jgi:hypothetical protein
MTAPSPNNVNGVVGSPNVSTAIGVLPVANGGTGGTGFVTAHQLSVFASGTAYSLTNTQAALTFGTTSPALTLNAAGVYMIFARVRLDYNAATLAANRTVTLKLRRTNNTPADLTGGSVAALTQILTTTTFTMGDYSWMCGFYTTANTNDAIAIFGGMDTAPTAGSLDAVEAQIMAIRLQQ